MAILIKQKSNILGYSNAVGDGNCEEVYDSLTQKAYFDCIDAHKNKPKKLAKLYENALLSGKTTDTYEVWFQKNKDKIQGFATAGKGFLDSLFGGGSVQVDTPNVTVDTKKDNSGLIYLGIGVVIVAGIGIYAYKQMK